MSVWYCKKCDQFALYRQGGLMSALEWVDEDGNERCQFGTNNHPLNWKDENDMPIMEYVGEFE